MDKESLEHSERANQDVDSIVFTVSHYRQQAGRLHTLTSKVEDIRGLLTNTWVNSIDLHDDEIKDTINIEPNFNSISYSVQGSITVLENQITNIHNILMKIGNVLEEPTSSKGRRDQDKF